MLTMLKLNETYLDTNGKSVVIVKQFTNEDADYAQGFRWRGDNGYSYNDDGTIVGGIGAGQIIQMGAVELVMLASDLTPEVQLEIGSYYTNGIGAVVQIARAVTPGTTRYKSGFRYIDHRGTYYTDSGSVKSWMFQSLNLKAQVAHAAVTESNLSTIIAQTVYVDGEMTTTRKVISGTAGVAVGVGAVKLGVGALRMVARV